MNAPTKFWAPRLVKLTAIGNPEVAGGAPQSTFIDPNLISLIYRSLSSWVAQRVGGIRQGKPFELIECTAVWLRQGPPHNVLVLESPEEVALRRDRALEVPTELRGIE